MWDKQPPWGISIPVHTEHAYASIFNSENDDNDQLTVDNNGVPPYRHYRHG